MSPPSSERRPLSRPGRSGSDAGIQRILNRLRDTPAQVMGQAGITLRQTPSAVALLGDETAYRGLARSAAYRWFTDPSSRLMDRTRDHAVNSRVQASLLRENPVRYGDGSFMAQVVTALLDQSDDFRAVWDLQEAGLSFPPEKHLDHQEVGALELYCQTLVDDGSGQTLLVFTAAPGSASHDRLALLSVLGGQLPEAQP
jgi:MmyB-like transcription regulator ligand binding domain